MLVQDFPISTPYGYVPGYPLNNGFHQGIDYACPTGTALIVNGVTVALTNNTGASTGAHLHVGKYVNGVVQNPGVGNGFKFTSAVVYDTGSDATNGNFVRITGDGALWNYLHLEKTLVTKGQVLTVKEEPMSVVNDGDTTNYFLALFDRAPDQAELDKNRGKEWNSPDPKLRAPLYNDMISRGHYLTEENKRLQKLVDDSSAQYVPITEQLFKKG